MTTAVSTTLLSDLILARLLASGKRPPALSRLRADLERFFKHPPAAEQWQEHLDELVQAGLLAVRPYRLTDAGRTRALEFLGMDDLPARTDWKAIRARYLVPKALGIPPGAGETRKRLSKAEGLGALLLKEHYDLPAGAGTSLPRAAEALACKKLGFPNESSLAALCDAVLSRLLGATERLDRKQLRKQLAGHVLGARRAGVEGLREAVLQRWLGGADSDHAESTAVCDAPVDAGRFDLPVFAGTVQAAARDCPTGRFGDNKVFINHVWRHLRNEPGIPALDLAAFKGHLTEANQAGLIHLSRADLVQFMDEADIRESETAYENAVFHFILIERDLP